MSWTTAIRLPIASWTRTTTGTSACADQVTMATASTALRSKRIARMKTFVTSMLIVCTTQHSVAVSACARKDTKATAELATSAPSASRLLTVDITQSVSKESVNVTADMNVTTRTCKYAKWMLKSGFDYIFLKVRACRIVQRCLLRWKCLLPLRRTLEGQLLPLSWRLPWWWRRWMQIGPSSLQRSQQLWPLCHLFAQLQVSFIERTL